MHQKTTTSISKVLHVISAICLYIFAIYSNIVFLYINKTYTNAQPVSVIIVFIIELIGLISLFRIQVDFITEIIGGNILSKYLCGTFIILGLIYAARVNAYFVAYNFMISDKHPNNYDALYVNLIISTILHSICMIFNFIISIINIYKKQYNEEQIISV